MKSAGHQAEKDLVAAKHESAENELAQLRIQFTAKSAEVERLQAHSTHGMLFICAYFFSTRVMA